MGEDYEYDENKNRSNLEKHGYDLIEVPLLRENNHLESYTATW